GDTRVACVLAASSAANQELSARGSREVVRSAGGGLCFLTSDVLFDHGLSGGLHATPATRQLYRNRTSLFDRGGPVQGLRCREHACHQVELLHHFRGRSRRQR